MRHCGGSDIKSCSELYENSLNRHYFMPFIAALERQCKLHEMNSNCDHRLLTETDEEHSRYILYDDSEPPDVAASALDAAFQSARNEECMQQTKAKGPIRVSKLMIKRVALACQLHSGDAWKFPKWMYMVGSFVSTLRISAKQI